jgi:hypothetical protein
MKITTIYTLGRNEADRIVNHPPDALRRSACMVTGKLQLFCGSRLGRHFVATIAMVHLCGNGLNQSHICNRLLATFSTIYGINQTTGERAWNSEMKNVLKARLNQMGADYTTRIAGSPGTIGRTRDMHFHRRTITPRCAIRRCQPFGDRHSGVLQCDTAVWTAKQQTKHTCSFS